MLARGCALLLSSLLTTACLTPADGADASAAPSTPAASTSSQRQEVDDCHVGIVGGRCEAKLGGCELGLTCAKSGLGQNYVCVRACTSEDDCPYPSRCVADGADGGSARRCMRPCSGDTACRCAVSACADGYCR